MEIVLTADERAQIHKDAADAFFLKDDGAYDGLSFPESVKLAQQELLASIDESLCRAQVRKVASEWERYIDSGECPFSERDENGECDWESCKVCRARYFVVALKAAGEEGK